MFTLDEVREMGKKQRVDPVPPKEDGEHINPSNQSVTVTSGD